MALSLRDKMAEVLGESKAESNKEAAAHLSFGNRNWKPAAAVVCSGRRVCGRKARSVGRAVLRTGMQCFAMLGSKEAGEASPCR